MSQRDFNPSDSTQQITFSKNNTLLMSNRIFPFYKDRMAKIKTSIET